MVIIASPPASTSIDRVRCLSYSYASERGAFPQQQLLRARARHSDGRHHSAMASELARIRAQIEQLQRQLHCIETDETRALDAHTLATSRDYARSCRDHSIEQVVEGCSRALRLYGFCVIDHVVPEVDVPRVRQEIVEATNLIPTNNRAAREGNATAVRRPARYPRLPGNEACHQVLFLPKLAEFIGHAAVTGVAREVLDDHIRIAQINTRPIRADAPDNSFQWNQERKPGFGTAGATEPSVDKTTWREW